MVNSRETCGMSKRADVRGATETQMYMRGYSLKIWGVILLLPVVCFFSLTSEAKYGGGKGEPNEPYLIYDANQMNSVGGSYRDWNKCFKLMADIDLGGYAGDEFNIIGELFLSPFSGVFDGNGHTISNFKYDCNGVNSIGLFGYVKGSDAEIKNLGLLDPNVDAGSGSTVGSLVGFFDSGSLSNCYARGGRVAGNQSVGGLAGLTYTGIITRCSSSGIVEGSAFVGGLLGSNLQEGKITDCYSKGSVEGDGPLGGLVGRNWCTNTANPAKITNCYSSASVSGIGWQNGGLVGSNRLEVIIEDCYATGNVTGEQEVGGLVGRNYYGKISDCSATGSVEGTGRVGGLVGNNTDRGKITNCCWIGDRVAGDWYVGGLVGYSGGYLTTIRKCFAEAGSVEGQDYVGGLVGENNCRISYCYSRASVSGRAWVGGLVGDFFDGTASDCYSTGEVTGDRLVGGLVGDNRYGEIYVSYWDIETSRQTSSDGGRGRNTDEMQTMSTFSWDFTTPRWTIDEGVDYPRLWWEFVGVLRAEPEITLGTSNIISWDPIPGVNDFYAECAEDANFTSIVYNSGWIAETSFEFTGLEAGRQYWYSFKARNKMGEECQWSNVETSLQGTLADVVEMKLGPESLKNNNMQNSLLNKIEAAQEMIDQGLYEDALRKLEHDILEKMDGCSETGEPDKNDWIITCEEQAVIYPLLMDTIEHVGGLME
ncbi:MAG: GLUG motif-containing protein [Planctomycetota bacterium]